MIAVPNNQSYTWGDVQLLESDTQGGVLFGPAPVSSLTDSTYIDPVLWRWENGTYASDTVTMVPFAGYWVRANRANLFLKFPNAAAVSELFSERSSAGMGQSTARRQSAARIRETPPMPMRSDTSPETDKGGCFLNTLAIAGKSAALIRPLRNARDSAALILPLPERLLQTPGSPRSWLRTETYPPRAWSQRY